MKNKFLITFFLISIFTASTCPAFGASLPQNSASPKEEAAPVTQLPPAMAAEENPPDLEAAGAILIDAATGEILYEKNSSEKLFPASITKLMTVLLAFESGNLNDTITFSTEAVHGIEYGSSNIGIKEGEELTMEQALYAMMLQSANEVCLGVAEHISGSIEAFCKLMTDRAKELGAMNTNFVNPNGLHDENHYTTAYDMAVIARELLKYDQFKEVMGTVQYDVAPTNLTDEVRHLYTQNQLIKPPSIYVYEGCEGGKTGFTNEAQQTLVAYAKRGDTELISVVLKCHGAGHYEDTIKLFDYGFDNYHTAKIIAPESVSKEIPVTEEQKGEAVEIGAVTVTPEKEVYKTLLKDMNPANIAHNVILDETLPAPIQKGDIVGSIALAYDDTLLDTINLVAQNTVEGTPAPEKSSFLDKFLSIGDSAKNAFSEKSIPMTSLKFVGSLILAFLVLLPITRTIGAYKRKKRRAARRRRRNMEYRRHGNRETQN